MSPDETLAQSAPHREPSDNPMPMPTAAEPSPLAEDAQWSRLSGVLAAGIDIADSACRHQREAADQLDAAQYGLKKMLEELVAVMPSKGLAKPAAAPQPAAAAALPADVEVLAA